ncbi:isthmin-2 [Danio aesculapii]|uniref:isthmin-2 n=1 Tax=Danio aesculapii TaxID=1142201 RepID=UPI0024C034EF|nr:isthmin-2 [Danio aesculapii]
MLRARKGLWVLLSVLLAFWIERAISFPVRHHKRSRNGVYVENQVQNDLADSHPHQRRWLQHHSTGVLPLPKPEEESKPFVLDFKDFPDLANADIGSQNPNIQVTIEVLDDAPMDVEMDLVKEWSNDWSTSSPSSTVEWLGGKKLFWPLFWGYTDADSGEDGTGQAEDEEDDYDYDSGEPIPSGLGKTDGDWTHNHYEEKEEEWSTWSPCSVTCGHGNQTRSRSCGDFCTSTESQSCVLVPCPDDWNSVAHVFPFEMENGTEPYGTDVDSCEKWLNCKSEFLQRYLQQVLTELPNCPCSYPSYVSNNIVSLLDVGHDRSFQWRDASGPKERLDIYKPSAQSCLRSGLSKNGTTLAAQHCCYDDNKQLITRGKGAGTPNLISTEFSPELHFKVDVLPWILCKGDWSRFQAVRPPNNGLQCMENPQQDIFMNELEEVREY